MYAATTSFLPCGECRNKYFRNFFKRSYYVWELQASHGQTPAEIAATSSTIYVAYVSRLSMPFAKISVLT
jgi:hypothetical protein